MRHIVYVCFCLALMPLETLNFILIIYRFLTGLTMRECVYGSQWWKKFIYWKCAKHRRLQNATTRIQASNAIHPTCHLHLLVSSLNPMPDGLINLHAQKITDLVDHRVVQLINFLITIILHIKRRQLELLMGINFHVGIPECR